MRVRSCTTGDSATSRSLVSLLVSSWFDEALRMSPFAASRSSALSNEVDAQHIPSLDSLSRAKKPGDNRDIPQLCVHVLTLHRREVLIVVRGSEYKMSRMILAVGGVEVDQHPLHCSFTPRQSIFCHRHSLTLVSTRSIRF